MYKVYFITFGCKVNQYETECLKADFTSKGFLVEEAPVLADVIIINSCTVTASGDSKSLYAVRKLRKQNPEAVIVLTGCLPQASPEIAEKLPEVDIVTGTKHRNRIVEIVEQYLINNKRSVEIGKYGKSDEFEALPINTGFEVKTRAFLKIQDGCNQFCSYCIIPYARGRCRSKPIDEIRAEVSALAEAGHKEIVLVGINLAFYGVESGIRLVDAVEACCRVPGVERVRLGSLEPEMISEEDLARLSKLTQFCPQFHLSLQSGSAATLKRMNRRYTPEEYFALVTKIRKIFPEASFTTDIMVGFPHETDEEFHESLEFAEKVGFSKIHVFQYSPRKGTKAAGMPQLSKKVKEQRAERMKALGEKLQRNHLEKMVGKTVPVLFERENCTEFHHGYAPDYTLIKIPRENSKKSLRNMIFCVTIKESESDCCIGEATETHI